MKQLIAMNNLDVLRNKLLGLEMQLKIAEDDSNELILRIKFLKNLKEELKGNLEFLKKDGVVVTIRSYSDSTKDLKETEGQLAFFERNLSRLKKTIENYEKDIDKTYDDIDVYENVDNVIPLFRKSVK